MHPVIRRYRKNDEVEVLQLSQKYASWDSTPTEADIQGFHSSEPDFFLVAELNQKIIGFVYGHESKNVPEEVLRKWKATRVGSVEVLAVEEKVQTERNRNPASEEPLSSLHREGNRHGHTVNTR